MGQFLVTGAAGFIGSALATRLLADGHDVVTIDNLSTGLRERIPPGCRSILGNAHDSETIDQLRPYAFDAIYHVAGQSGGTPSFADPVYDLQANTQSTLRLLQFAERTGCKKFIYASSMAVYGDPMELPVLESAPAFPKTFYGVSKAASESYLRLYSSEALYCTALRLNNVYGPGQDLSNLNQGMASIFLGQAIEGSGVLVKGSTDRFRDFVYIDDAVSAFLRAGERDAEPTYRIYNVATGVPTTVETVLRAIEQALGTDVDIIVEGTTPGDQFGIYCSYQLIASELGWHPETDFTTGMDLMTRWALQTRIAAKS